MCNNSQINEALKLRLLEFSRNYVDVCINETNEFPIAEGYNELDSPCIKSIISSNELYWEPFILDTPNFLLGVERGLEMQINDDAHTFYGVQYSADFKVKYGDLQINLIQAWSEDDHIRLQENLICHLVAQRKSKRKPTLFIGSTEDDDLIISCCNLTGNILLESLNTGSRTILNESAIGFLNDIKMNNLKNNE